MTHHAPKTKMRSAERGNALVYVLIAIALFAALSMTLARQSDTGEASGLAEEKAELYATQIIAYASQAQGVVDQMLIAGSKIDTLEFTRPNAAGFNETDPADNIHKVHHPDGGGLSPANIPGEATVNDAPSTPAGYYFKVMQVPWTKSTATDVIFSAYRLKLPVCEKIQQKINGTTTIPAKGGSASLYDILTNAASAAVIDATTCPGCSGQMMFTIKDGSFCAFYSIVAQR